MSLSFWWIDVVVCRFILVVVAIKVSLQKLFSNKKQEFVDRTEYHVSRTVEHVPSCTRSVHGAPTCHEV